MYTIIVAAFVRNLFCRYTSKDNYSIGLLKFPALHRRHCQTEFSHLLTNMKFLYFKTFLLCVLFAAFMYELVISLMKYSHMNTGFHISSWHQEEVLYPSLTVCKKPTFGEYIDDQILNASEFSTLQSLVSSHAWTREQVFYFLSHPRMLGLSYPCTTTWGGVEPGKPCSFPSPAQFDNRSGCQAWSADRPLCYTRLSQDGSFYKEQDEYGLESDYWQQTTHNWGYCPDNCSGQVAEPASDFNLARREEVWQGRIVDLRTWDAGICYTYEPPGKSRTDVTSQLFAFLGASQNKDSVITFDLYLHEKGQFWPREGANIQGEKITLKTGVEVELSFSITQVTVMDKTGRSCTKDPDYSLTECLVTFIEREVGCSLPLLANNTTTLECATQGSISAYYHKLIWLKTASVEAVASASGCWTRCSYLKYKVTKRKETVADWRKGWVSSFFLAAESGLIRQEVCIFVTWCHYGLVGGVPGVRPAGHGGLCGRIPWAVPGLVLLLHAAGLLDLGEGSLA